MSDEYGSSGSGFGGSLVSDSLDPKDTQAPTNNPPEGDTTSEGGYGGDPFSDANQRGSDKSSRGQLGPGAQDAPGERDPRREDVDKAPSSAAGLNEQGEGAGLSDSLNPYGASSQDSAVGSGAADRRGEAFESGPGAAGEQDDGGQGQI